MSVTAGERRIVSVLIADVAGSTSIAEKLGPERSKFLFDDIVRLMRQEVERFGGTVAQLTGDGVLALFGAPVAHEDDSERAVRAALAIREALDGYAAEVAPAYGIELGARVARQHGPGRCPGRRRAARCPLQRARRHGQRGGAPASARRPRRGTDDGAPGRRVRSSSRQLGDLELKGRSEPVTAFRVAGIRDADRRARRNRHSSDARRSSRR